MFQQTMIIGNLGRDPEMRYTSNGKAVCDFSVAVSRQYTDSSGQRQEKTTWFRVTAWEKLGELCNQYLTKGRQVMVIGEVSASAYMPKDGGTEPRATIELRADTVKFLGNRGEGGAPGSGGAASGSGDNYSYAGPGNYGEDDLPF